MRQVLAVCLFVLLAACAVASLKSGDATDALSFSIRECPNPLRWDQVANVSTQNGRGFYLSDCSAPAIQQTFVKACYDAEFLRLHFFNIDNNIYNPYTNCNDPLFNDDVVEVFIAPKLGEAPVHHYVEIELSPNSVLFASNITNPGLTCQGISGVSIPCNLISFHTTRNDRANQWWGELGLPWKVISQNQGDHGPGIPRSWVINMFRIDTPLGRQKEYSCWSCDESSPPCFHKPAFFGTMTLR